MLAHALVDEEYVTQSNVAHVRKIPVGAPRAAGYIKHQQSRTTKARIKPLSTIILGSSIRLVHP